MCLIVFSCPVSIFRLTYSSLIIANARRKTIEITKIFYFSSVEKSITAKSLIALSGSPLVYTITSVWIRSCRYIIEINGCVLCSASVFYKDNVIVWVNLAVVLIDIVLGRLWYVVNCAAVLPRLHARSYQ